MGGLRFTQFGWVDDEGKPVKMTVTEFEVKIRDKEGRLQGGVSMEDPKGIEADIDPETGLPLIKAERAHTYGPETPWRRFLGRLLGRGKER